jgi:hypothetical protein
MWHALVMMNSLSKVGLALVVQLAATQAGLITPLSATPSSEITSPNRRAVNAINGSGMSGPGNAGDSHSIGENGLVWTTGGESSPPNDLNPEITFDLGASYDVTRIREWGYNDSWVDATSGRPVKGFSPKQVNVYTSADGVAFTFAGTVYFAQAPGTNGAEEGLSS